MTRYTVTRNAGGRTVERNGRKVRLTYAVIDGHTGARVAWHGTFTGAQSEAKRRNKEAR